ncbi:MAG: S8 family serine peptidase [Bacillota bacterium]
MEKARKLGLVLKVAGVLAVVALFATWGTVGLAQSSDNVRALLTVTDTSAAALQRLAAFGRVDFVFPQIGVVAIETKPDNLRPGSALRSLSFVTRVERDKQVVKHSHTGRMAWDQDIIDVELAHPGGGTVVADGSGVFVAVLDTGLVPNWRDYFPEDRIATALGRAFHTPIQGTPGSGAYDSDTDGHGTHVTSTILGYNLYTLARFEGTAPNATVIPVKVLGNQGWGWESSVIAGILYVADLKQRSVIGPTVINMSLGSAEPSFAELAAIRYAISQGVLVVASAGNEGEEGMAYPGAYPDVISVGAAGWVEEWYPDRGWWQRDVPEDITADRVYVTDFSSRERPGQELDVLAPGSWVVGPYLYYGAARPPYWAQGVPGQYYFLGGTSMASPHVAGTAALMLQVKPNLTQQEAQAILRATALPIPPGSAQIKTPWGTTETVSWGAGATGYGLIQTDAAVEAAAATP